MFAAQLLSGRSATVLASLSSLSSSGCVLSLSCVGCSRLASCRRGVGPSWALPMPVCFRPAVANVLASRACCSPAVSPHPCFWGGDKPAPKTSLTVGTPWAVCSPSPNLLVSWVGGLSSCGVGSSPARRCRKNDCIYIIPAPLRLVWGYVSPNPPTKYNIVTKKATAFSVAILHLYMMLGYIKSPTSVSVAKSKALYSLLEHNSTLIGQCIQLLLYSTSLRYSNSLKSKSSSITLVL